MWFELMPHGMREVTDDEILTVAEKIKVYRAMRERGHGTEPPTLYLCQMPSHSHSLNPCGGYAHAHCHCCPRR